MSDLAASLRSRLPTGEIPTVVLVLLMTLLLVNATVVMQWVKGGELLVPVAVDAAVLMTVLALIRRLPSAISLLIGLVGLLLVPYYYCAHALIVGHPNDPWGLPGPETWIQRIGSGDQGTDNSLFLFILCAAFWIVGGWLAWCVVRWRRPLLGLYPGVATLAVNILNSRDEENGYTLFFLILTFALLLWNGYRDSIGKAMRAGLRMSSDSRWDFWETGVAATVGLTLLAIFLPPLSSQDATVNVENGVFRDWAQFSQNLSRQVPIGKGGQAQTSTGFALEAGLNGPLKRSDKVVLIYQVEGTYTGPRYFRGVNLGTGLRRNDWTFVPNSFGFTSFVAKGEVMPYVDQALTAQLTATFKVKVQRPPQVAPDVLFYPGEVLKLDRDSIVVDSYRTSAAAPLLSVDRLNSSHPPTSAGPPYRVVVQYPNPTEPQLRLAGTDYPEWLAPYRTLVGVKPPLPDGTVAVPRDPMLARFQKLALELTANETNPYDKAIAIQTYLRDNYTYKLEPPPVPVGRDSLDYFLFDSKEAYCEYFASAMGDLLRSIGIPTRLVNGYGPGTYDSKNKQFVVRELDSHTWVEVYFPHLGWVPFEPTPDGQYFPISRAVSDVACSTDAQCARSETAPSDPSTNTAKKPGVKDVPGDIPEQGAAGAPGSRPYWLIYVGLLVGALGALFVVLSRYLRPRDPNQVWRRLNLLSRLAGLPHRAGETPREYGGRLAAAIPEAATPIRELTDNFVVAAYAPPALARPTWARIVEVWAELRPHLLRRLAGRLRLAW